MYGNVALDVPVRKIHLMVLDDYAVIQASFQIFGRSSVFFIFIGYKYKEDYRGFVRLGEFQ